MQFPAVAACIHLHHHFHLHLDEHQRHQQRQKQNPSRALLAAPHPHDQGPRHRRAPHAVPDDGRGARDCSDEKAPLTIAVVTTAMLAAKAQKELHADMQLRREAAAAHSRRLIADVTADQDVAASVLVVDPSHDTPEAMESALAASAAIFVLGGNTFYLWHHMRRTGLNELVRRRVDEGAVYVGLSAGSIVAGRTIATAFWKGWDDPEACVPHCDWSQPSAVAAMNLVGDRSFFPHFTQEWEALVQRRGDELGHDLVTLREEGAYVSGGETCAARTVEGREEAESEESEITMVSSLPL